MVNLFSGFDDTDKGFHARLVTEIPRNGPIGGKAKMTIEKHNIQTPAILLDLDVLERNIGRYHQMAVAGGKKLWPMIKTHKSTEIAQMQLNHGATGFLCGTLDECEAICENIVRGQKKDISIMYAYPVASFPNISRVIKLAGACNFYLRIDNYKQALLLNKAASEAGVHINYTVIINCGLNRFGVTASEAAELVEKIADLNNIKFCGISTHPGHVYGETDFEGVAKIARQESDIMKNAATVLNNIGITPKLISSGSTPTHTHIADDAVINCLHPGNYVFMDNMQVALDCAKEKDCALTVLTTVISARPGEFIIDAGAKCFGLDKGAHGNSKIKGHGWVKNQDENMLTISSLSEEVGKITVSDACKDRISLQIGDKLEIIPNHSCAVANNTSCYVAIRNDIFDRLIHVDMRGNSAIKI